MPDLNNMLSKIKNASSEVELNVKKLFVDYDELFREARRQLSREKADTGSMNGLEDFYRLTQLLKRNRDVISSMMRGVKNLRSIEKYSFIEELDEKPKEKFKEKSKKSKKEPEINKKEISEVRILEGGVVNA